MGCVVEANYVDKPTISGIPEALLSSSRLVRWVYKVNDEGKLRKTPCDTQGFPVGYQESRARVPLEKADQLLDPMSQHHLGITLLDGLPLQINGQEGWLWALDFDGFVELDGPDVDDGVLEFLDFYSGYGEISPSKTGFKLFFVSDKQPTTKFKIYFGPSEFLKTFSKVRKYEHREIEVFSRNSFLTLTGDVFDGSTRDLTFIDCEQLDALVDYLNDWAVSTGGKGLENVQGQVISEPSASTATKGHYSKLTEASLRKVLEFIDHQEEETWTKIAYILARVYGEQVRAEFQSYSKGDFCNVRYQGYSTEECDQRFDRALDEVQVRPNGHGIKQLLSLAREHPDWLGKYVEFEDDFGFKPFEVVEGGFIYEDADLAPIAAAASPEAAQGGPLGRLKGFSITGRSSDLRQQMLDDKFVLDQIAILGQWTNIYAAPNTGKTLLTLTMLRDQIRANVICGEQVFYVNADDTYRGMVEKLEIAESIGLQMLVPNQQGFVVSNIVDLMSDLAIANEAANVVIVLDTLKKFTDLMDKRVASQFGNIARGFVAAGGTLITLAHTNKHKDSQGKSIYSGTSDIRDDGDCFYIIDKIGVDKGFGTERYTVEFTNDKNRGDVAGTVGFSFEKRVGETYADLLGSVKRLSSGEIERSKVAKEVQAELDDDADLIAAVADCLGAGINTKSAIVKKVRESTGDSNDKVRKLMAKRTGTFYELGHRWTVIKGANNAQFYQVLPPPSV